MDCIKNNKRGVEILTDYCAGILDPAVAFEIDTHSAQCAECRKLVEAQRTVWEMLDVWTPLEVSQNFDARLYARIAEEQAEPAWRRWLRRVFLPPTPHRVWKPAISLAAAGAVVALVVAVRPVIMPDQVPFAHTPPSTSKTESYKSTTVQAAMTSSEEIDLEQLQQALDDMELLAPAGGQPPSGRL
jgi:anti-sigma-K factor RskA